MINGLVIIPEFITKKLEKDIVLGIPDVWHTVYQHRAVQEYGEPIYKGELFNPIPPDGNFLILEMIERGAFKEKPKHISVNRYLPGDFITAHIDKPEGGEVVTILSLLSDVEMVFQKGDDTRRVTILRRSLTRLEKEARWEWTHETLPTENLRYSIVFRK